MAKEKAATPVNDDDCFGKFYDPKDGDCKSCNENKKCAAMMAKGKSAKEADADDDDEDEEEAPPAKATKAAPAKGKAPAKKVVEPEDDDEDDDEEEAPAPKSKKAAPPTKGKVKPVEPDEDDEDEEEAPPAKTTKKAAVPEKAAPKGKKAPETVEEDDDEEEAPPAKPAKKALALAPAPAKQKAAPAPKAEESDDDEEEPDEEELESLITTIKKKARLIAKAVLAGKSLMTYAEGRLDLKAFDPKKAFKQASKKKLSPEQIEFRDYCRTELKDDAKMLKVCRALKLKWNEHETPMVNRMRMTMALKDHFFKNDMALEDITKLLKAKK